MSDSLTTALVSIVLAIIGLASLAVILSPKASTGQVIQAGTGGLATDIMAATGPVTGNNPSVGGLGISGSIGNGL